MSFLVEPRFRLALTTRLLSSPANIGPYSQTVTLAGLTFVAGQIGLTPHTMKLPSRTTEEIGTSLSNLQAVVSGAGRDLATGTVSCICYITDSNLIEPARASWESIVDARVPLVFAPVAGLPRGANIEWEVVVTNPESVIRYDSDDEDDERNGAGHYQDGNNDEFEENGNLDFRGSSSVSCALRARRHGSYFGCIGTIKGISSESMELAFGTLLDKMRSAISSFSPTASKNLFAARILHDGGIATNNLRLISNDSKTGFPDVAVAWVPVLPSPEFQIAVCVHGQLDRS